jgi:hypothetical protein
MNQVVLVWDSGAIGWAASVGDSIDPDVGIRGHGSQLVRFVDGKLILGTVLGLNGQFNSAGLNTEGIIYKFYVL